MMVTTSVEARRLGMLATLCQRDFALLWFGGLLSNLGSWSTFIAIPLLVYSKTGSALATTMVFTVTVVPLLLSSIAGVFVDRWDRRRILVAANVVLALLTMPLLLARSGHVWIIYAASLALTLAGLVVAPAENALLPRLVGPDRLPAANSLNALNDSLGRIAGPAVGGGLLAVGGFIAVVSFDACTFMIAAVLVGLIRTNASPSRERPRYGDGRREALSAQSPAGWRQDWLDGMASVRASPLVTVIFAAAGTALLGDAALSSLLAPFVAQTLASGAGVLGLFLTIRGVGGVIGSFVSARISRRVSARHLIGWNLIALAAVVATLVAVPLVPVALIAAGFLGVFVVGWATSEQTLIQGNVADRYLGRTYGVLGTITAVTLLIGSLVAGALADRVGVPPLLYSAAVCYVAGGLWALFGLRLIRTIQNRPGW
jgi:predicted MFS family arabinose efflux permease